MPEFHRNPNERQFKVERFYRNGHAYQWRAKIVEEVPGGGWEGRMVYGRTSYTKAITRLGLYIAVRRECKRIKRGAEGERKPLWSKEKIWRIKL